MKIITDSVRKVIEIWVPSNTDNETVDELCRKNSLKGYLTVVYRSGKGDLLTLTRELLSINK